MDCQPPVASLPQLLSQLNASADLKGAPAPETRRPSLPLRVALACGLRLCQPLRFDCVYACKEGAWS